MVCILYDNTSDILNIDTQWTDKWLDMDSLDRRNYWKRDEEGYGMTVSFVFVR